MKKILSTEGVVLHKTPSGEHFWRYTLCTPQHGKLICLQRDSSKKKGQVLPDLFDIGVFEIEVPIQGKATFIREYFLQHRLSSIGSSYERLKAAARFATIIGNNLQHIELLPNIYSLCCKTLLAFASAPYPAAALLKGLYVFARDEGYPVKEDWYPQLPYKLQSIAASILNTPLAELALDPGSMGHILEHLINWLHTHTDIVVEH